MDFAAQKRAAAAYQVASFETDFSQRPQELGPKPRRVEFSQEDASLTQSQYGGRCALCSSAGTIHALFDPARDEAARKLWVSDHDPDYLKQQRNAISLCHPHLSAFKDYKLALAPSEDTIRKYISSELADYEQRRKAAKVGQVKEPGYSLETRGVWVEVLPLQPNGIPHFRSPNPLLQNSYNKQGHRLVFLPNITGAVCYFMFLTAIMTLRNSQTPVNHTPRVDEMCDLVMHYATIRSRPDPVPKLRVEQQAVMMQQRVVESNKKDLGPQVNPPSLPASSSGGAGWSKGVSGSTFKVTGRPQQPLSPKIERPKTAMANRERRSSVELGSSLRGLSLGTPPRPGTAVPPQRSGSSTASAHRHHNSLQLPTFRSSRSGPSPPNTPTSPISPISPTSPSHLASIPRVTSPSPQKGSASMLDARPRRSSFTGGYATYADPAFQGSHLQRSLSPRSPQSSTGRSMSPSSFTSLSPTSSFSGSPPLSRVASPDPSPTFGARTLRPSSRSRAPSVSSANVYSKTNSHHAATNCNSLGMAVSAFPSNTRTFKMPQW